MSDLSGFRVLIVEDEYLIAQEMVRRFERAGANVVGPVLSVERAMVKVQQADGFEGAVLDVDLHGEMVFPVADELARRHVPFIFFTGYNDIVIPERFRAVRRLNKPADWEALIGALFGDLREKTREPVDKPTPAKLVPSGKIVDLLPRLRLAARALTGDTATADVLVAQALERAIAEADSCPADLPLERWLLDLLETTTLRARPPFLH